MRPNGSSSSAPPGQGWRQGTEARRLWPWWRPRCTPPSSWRERGFTTGWKEKSRRGWSTNRVRTRWPLSATARMWRKTSGVRRTAPTRRRETGWDKMPDSETDTVLPIKEKYTMTWSFTTWRRGDEIDQGFLNRAATNDYCHYWLTWPLFSWIIAIINFPELEVTHLNCFVRPANKTHQTHYLLSNQEAKRSESWHLRARTGRCLTF